MGWLSSFKWWVLRVVFRRVRPGVVVGVYISPGAAIRPDEREYFCTDQFERGPVAEPVVVGSFSQFVELFGGVEDGHVTDTAAEVYQFFSAGGYSLVVTRMEPDDGGDSE